MTPLQVKHYIKNKPRITASQLVNHFNIDRKLAATLLRFWHSRNNLQLIDSCDHCYAPCQEEAYIWK